MNQKGFTLVELAIVMMIIGLLIGAVFKGQELIENARVRKTISQVESYQAAMRGFVEVYEFLPGDVPVATTRLANCVTATNNCRDGNGDSVIGVSVVPWSNNAPDQSGPNTENTQIWKHLFLSDFIVEVDLLDNPIWGSSQPAARVARGGFRAVHSVTQGGGYTTAGLFLILVPNPTGPLTVPTLGGSVVRPLWASNIDIKIDDGSPSGGDVLAANGTPSPDCFPAYNMTNERENCIMAFRIWD